MKKIVRVEFLDHATVEDAKLEELKASQPVRCVLYGEVVVEAPSHIVVLSLGQEEAKDTDPQGFGMVVVRGAILNIVELEEKLHV